MNKNIIKKIIVMLVVLFPVILYMSFNSHKLVSNRDYKNVDYILTDKLISESGNYDEEAFFNLLKKAITRVPVIHSCNCERVEFFQYKIIIGYTDGTEDRVYVLNSSPNSNTGGYLSRSLEKGHIVPTAKSYSGYKKIIHYIESCIE